MKKHFQWIFALVLIIGGALVLARAQQGPGKGMGPGMGFGHGPGGMMGRMGKMLNLTDAQKEQIKSLHEQQRTALEPLMKQRAATRKDMLTATANGNFDQAKVTAIANQQAQIEAQLTVAREQLQSKIYNTVLTSEQKAQMDQMRQKEISRVDRWQAGGGPGPKQ